MSAQRPWLFTPCFLDCVFHFGCFSPSQLRIHGSRSVDFYVLVASGPIIEDCAGLRFAPWGLTYEGLHDQLQASGFAVRFLLALFC